MSTENFYIRWPSLGSGGGGSGTVTSVGLADSTNLFNITGSPVTTSGTLTLSSFKNQTANYFLAGPGSGSGAASFRAIVSADISGLFANFTEATSSVLTIVGGTAAVFGSGTTIQVKQASTSQSGYLSSTDWNTFNGKSPSGNFAEAGTGDVTWSAPSGPGNVTTTLAATSNSTLVTLSGLTTAGSLATVGTITSGTWHGTKIGSAYGGTALDTSGSTGVPVIASGTWSVDAKLTAALGGTGQDTSGSTGVPVISSGTWSVDSTLTVSLGGTGQGSALTQYGVITAASTTAMACTAAGTANYALVANSGSAPTFQQISLTAGVTGVLPIANGGTDNGSLAVTGGGVIFADGTRLQNTGAGTQGYVLISNGSSAPSFSALPTPITNNYWSGYMPNGSTWSTNSTSFVDATNSGGNTLTARMTNGITFTAAAGNVAGITITPASNTSAYQVTAIFGFTSGGYTASAQLFDGTNVIATSECGFAPGNTENTTLSGIWVPGTTSSSTIKIQLATSNASGTAEIVRNANKAASIEWSVVQIA